jgi:hypothetical protein
MYNSKKTLKSKSYSPSINKKLDVKSIRTLKNNKLNLCNNLLKVKVKVNNKLRCLNYNNKEVINFLLNNLKYSKHLDATKFIAPKQIVGNCWFNTMYVTFFFSDKGRKFFRFFRELMIKGEKVDKTKIKDLNLRKLFFILNLYIEASYNQNNYKKNTNIYTNLHDQIKQLTYNSDTNYYIKEIYNIINNSNNIKNMNIPNVYEAGNPIEFYKALINYLDYNILKILRIDVYNNININYLLHYKLNNYYVIPDIIILEDSIQYTSKNNTKYEKYYNINIKNNNIKYVLDSIILTNKTYFKKNANQHFVSVCTINDEEYKFDGDSYSRLSRFKWKNLINSNKDWDFIENPNYYPEKYNFTYGYKMMFYYREK